MKKHKSEKIEEVVQQHDRKLNLHEIKARTGAGSGHKYSTEAAESNPLVNKSTATTKTEKIQEAVSNVEGKVNLHKIKAQTGAGNGYKHPDNTYEASPVNDTFVNTNKFHKIHQVVTNIEGKVNLHKIKAQTGAGDGFIDQKDLKDNVNTPACDYSNPQCDCSDTHKSHKIHAVFHASDRRLNLHQIKQKTGAGSGYKN
ncbi:BFD-like [2Fe-2S] binding domain [uncultured Clostridium sp.]|uniref:hypothetical protein n=1 Tax=uncultured Clostridium sp. TaxID=59620 RepID=UPI000822564F|nr:hypothetical protein [uncultured Clostridium sp.]SCI83083.1 BFD-like [2Fe-2S] binding domain [uncultured Clostridium sp.]